MCAENAKSSLAKSFYTRWSEDDCVRTFAQKASKDFFESERRMLSALRGQARSVLDIGCASGRYVELLKSVWQVDDADIEFCGVDVSAKNIANARALYPNNEFHHDNALAFDPARSFDLVNAIGVMQHEPEFETLIKRMIGWSNKYVIFDVKFAAVAAPVVDVARSRAGTPENPLYFILLNYPMFRDFLAAQAEIARLDIYGYQTPINKRTIVPRDVPFVVSACVMITKGEARTDDFLNADLPADLDQAEV